jgi:drug/metabolite transporter (DMT)-like permease
MNVSTLRAVGFALASFTFWALADTCMKLAGDASLPACETIAFYGLFGALLLLTRAVWQGRTARLRPRNPRAQLVRGSLALISNLANVVALKYLPLTTFYVTVFCAPMVIALAAAVFLRERLSLSQALAVAAGFAGVLIALGPEGAAGPDRWIGFTAALISVAAYCASTLWLRRMTQQETTDSLAFFAACVELAFGAAALLFIGFKPVSPGLLLILIAMGLLGTTGTLFNCVALKYTSAANVSQFHYTQIIVGAILGYLIWHETPGLHLWLGAAVIAAAGLYIADQARRADGRLFPTASVRPPGETVAGRLRRRAHRRPSYTDRPG